MLLPEQVCPGWTGPTLGRWCQTWFLTASEVWCLCLIFFTLCLIKLFEVNACGSSVVLVTITTCCRAS